MSIEEKAKAYDEALKRARKYMAKGYDVLMPEIFPQLRESEDERIRKELIFFLKEEIPQCSIKEHADKLKAFVSYLEKQKERKKEFHIPSYMGMAHYNPAPIEQKEQKPIEPSDEELERHQKELYDFKVFAAKQAKEHHISFIHDFEWNNFCAELLSYFHEQKPADDKAFEEWLDDWYQGSKEAGGDIVMSEAEFKNWSRGIKNMYQQKPAWSEEDEKILADTIFKLAGFMGNEKNIAWLKSLRPQLKQEWSNEDESCWNLIWDILDGPFTASKESYKKAAAWFLKNCPKGTKSLRPSWKPSDKDELMKLKYAGTSTKLD